MFTVRLENIKIRKDLVNSEVARIAYAKFNISQESVIDYKIVKKSIDARDKNDIFYNYSIVITLNNDFNISRLQKNKNAIIIEKEINPESKTTVNNLKINNMHPIIIGAGPAGLFCALTLVENGINPIIVEQGKRVEERKKDVEIFRNTGKLNTASNIQFGEGGAGTFSDGKLTTNLHNPLCKNVINMFVKFGAPEEISYINKPHIGTDNLVKVVANIRKYIIEKGGTFLFNTKAENFVFENEQVKEVICKQHKQKEITNKDFIQIENDNIRIKTNCVILAIGHSSRDMFTTLYEKNVCMEPKNFSAGVRIEHKQKMINHSQYGTNTKLKLQPAEYKLAYHGENHSCYTFCMCPGGEVMASSSEEGTIVTNGMSTFARNGENANSAVLVNVTPEDLNSDKIITQMKEYYGKKLELCNNSPLLGMYFQKMLEEKAFKLAGANYNAPIQRVEDFINNKKTTKIGEVNPTYKPGVTMCNLQEILPEFVIKTLKDGIIYFNKKIDGFANPDAILTGVETRSSSPVTIKRNENYMSNINGIYPCGEGAGYAGGIMSAAVDGIKIANQILKTEALSY